MRGFAVVGVGWLALGNVIAQPKPIALEFRSLLRPTERGLAPTQTLLKANGKRVQLVGFMPQMEQAAVGGFWLTPTPVFQDESGAGSGDLPPNAIFIIVRGAGQRPVKYLAGKLAVSGKLKLNPTAPRIVITLDSTKDIVSKSSKLQ